MKVGITNTSESIRQKALSAIPWVSAAGPQVVAFLVTNSHLEWINDGKTILSRGQDCSHLIVVVEGAIESSMTSVEGKRHVISHLGPGQVLGLIPLTDEAGAIHDSSAKGATLLLLVPRNAFRQAMAQHPLLAEQVIRLLSSRARYLYIEVAEKSLLRLDQRLARVLLRQPWTQENHCIEITQAELAELLGVTRQSVNHEIQSMEKAGLIRSSRGHIYLIHVPALCAFCGYDAMDRPNGR